MKAKLTPLVLALATVGYQPTSLAATMEDLRINGFLSAGVAVTDNDQLSVGSIDEDASFKEDTILGLQISAPISDRFSLTGQLVAKGTEDYEVDAAWAYASFQASDELQLRIGRLRAPLYYYSDSLEVGYSYHWIRPPEEIYGGGGLNNLDAIDAIYTTELGDVETSFQVYYGRFDQSIDFAGTQVPFDLTNWFGAIGTFTLDVFTARLSYHQADFETPGFPILPNDPETGGFLSGALVYNDDTNFILLETTKFTIDTGFNDSNTLMLTYSRTLTDEFTAHLTYADRDEDQAAAAESRSYIAGLRWDIESNVALKFEVQHADERTGSSGNGEDGMIYSTAVDLVF